MKRILLFWIIIAALGCKDREAHKVPPVDGKKGIVSVSAIANESWREALANGEGKIAALYLEEAYKIYPDGNHILGDSSIAYYYTQTGAEIAEIYTDTLIVADKEGRYAYEIGGFLTDAGAPFKHLIIWNTTAEEPLREVELIAETQYYSEATEELETARELWMEYCNANNAGALIENMYTDNALYYNHKPMIFGRPPLIEEYSYMNNPEYSLKLQPLYLAQVTNELVYEIGQCSGSYRGKYVIVWEKQPGGNWQVLFDSNI